MHSRSAHQAGSIKLFHHTHVKFSIDNVHWSVLTSYLILSASCSVFSLISMMTCDTGFSIRFSTTTWKHIVQSFHRCWHHQQVSQLGWIRPRLCSDHAARPPLHGHPSFAQAPLCMWNLEGFSGSSVHSLEYDESAATQTLQLVLQYTSYFPPFYWS